MLFRSGLSTELEERSAIMAPWIDDPDLHAAIESLRAAGEIVVQLVPSDDARSAEYCLDRVLTQRGTTWQVEPRPTSKVK